MAQQLLLLSPPPSSHVVAVGTTQFSLSYLSSSRSIFTPTKSFSFARVSASQIPNPRELHLSVKCRQSSDYFEQSPPRFSPSYSPNPPSSYSTGLPPKVLVGHSIYKGKAAMTVEPRPPAFVPLQVFSLSVAEIGSLISLEARESCEFFHDPNKGRSDEGKVRKALKVEPLPDGSGHFFSLSVQNKILNVNESIYVPISKAEFAVLVSAFNFILPYLLGWHIFADSIRAVDSSPVNNTNPRGSVDYEWSR
ncbi:hypothetical protein Cgig2_031254 [Carnegiea gigantea]|uniref:Uncharacterized protein n=1 Tax=Carnegiea gigantea TaxID=171969 RepID=A0A9Q1QKZ6_9CARY|nr:hypothetical protein Cgig2_031254 [Carnegiea gigantea]